MKHHHTLKTDMIRLIKFWTEKILWELYWVKTYNYFVNKINYGISDSKIRKSETVLQCLLKDKKR